MEGPLSKWTNVMKGWQYRWFVLDDNAGLLSYYTSKDKMIRGARRGCVRLQDAVIGIDDEEDSTFTITVDQKIFHFQARDSEERKEWVCSLEETILRHNQRKVQGPSVPSLSEFDKRLAEADAYLQLLIENIKRIDNKVNTMDANDSGKQDVEGVLATAQEMVEAVKKSIVLLQLAKVAVTANQSTPSPPINADIEAQSVGAFTKAPNGDQNGGNVDVPNLKHTSETGDTSPAVDVMLPEVQFPSDEVLKDPTNVARSSFELLPTAVDSPSNQDDTVPHLNTLAPDNTTVPSVSFSSSEDENEFFDADEELSSNGDNRSSKERQKTVSDTLQEVASPNNVNSNKCESENLSENSGTKLTSTTIDDADMYMKEESHTEKEGESLEEHKSVIMHLLSQVKLGMDLTKVVLPTFILEKRSLLEMYADFFSHADYFLEIAQKPTAEERMISCVRFYLSTFGAGRNSSVAKKPYNPILGETFQCFWDHETFPTKVNPPVLVEDGPVPWAKSNQLTFLAEQVSHHPPISAFYAEHKDQKITFNGHIWTKSKFLGLSVGVHNIGQGCVRLVELGEEYILNFPNGYGRSILTVPWFELGGDCTITCEKTGYNAFIKFHTKPFYGGKIHKVTGEIIAPNAKKPLCTFEGEWNTVIFCNHASGKSERFIDVKRPKIVKNVRKIVHQVPMESRRLWEVVTDNLTRNKIDEATEAKRKLEDKQRGDAKDRLENNVVYKPKYFHEDDCQNWIFNSMLDERI